MKIRQSFVSNSSTSSYIIRLHNMSDKPQTVHDMLVNNISVIDDNLDLGPSFNTEKQTIDYWKKQFKTYLHEKELNYKIKPNEVRHYQLCTDSNTPGLWYYEDASYEVPELTMYEKDGWC